MNRGPGDFVHENYHIIYLNMKFPEISLTFSPSRIPMTIFQIPMTIPSHWKNILPNDFFLTRGNLVRISGHKNIERHTAHTIVSWPNRKQWAIVHTSDLMMIIRQSIYILSIITRGVGKLKTHSPTYCITDGIMDNWENMLNLTHTLDKIYLTGIL